MFSIFYHDKRCGIQRNIGILKKEKLVVLSKNKYTAKNRHKCPDKPKMHENTTAQLAVTPFDVRCEKR